jgi:UDP-N-acetylglucosamine/UDP-N-acetylgalactosamine diphosphorylase
MLFPLFFLDCASQPTGSFIFDAFETVPPTSFFCMEVARAAEFAPVKNASGVDSPASARAALDALHRSWISAAGGTTEGEGVVEVCASLSYEGEGLEERCCGKSFIAPVMIK